MFDFTAFEAFEGEKPDILLDRHPGGNYLAMQVSTRDLFPAAIWDAETKRLVWSREDTCALAWLQHGTQLAALQCSLSSDEFFFTLYSWPQGHLLEQCSLYFPFGYWFDLFIAPTNDFAACKWTDQGEFGFEFISIQDHSVTHLAQHGYYHRHTNISTRVAFHPEYCFWVCAYEDNSDWWIDKEATYDWQPAKVGTREKLGGLLVFDHTHLLGEIPVFVTVTADYRPPNVKNFEENEYITDPVFLDAQRVMLRLPSGEEPIYDLSEFWKKALSQ